MNLRVIIADDQPIVRNGLKTILESDESIQVVGVAADGLEAIELANRVQPDVCLFDIRMPRLDGIAATTALAGPDVEEPLPIVVITTFDDDEYVYDALVAGARGFLLKDADTDLLIRAVRAAASGDAIITPEITGRLLQQFAGKKSAKTTGQLVEELSEREEAVLAVVAHGRTNAEIAEELFISLNTVKSHVKALMTKIGVRNRVELAIWAHETGRV